MERLLSVLWQRDFYEEERVQVAYLSVVYFVFAFVFGEEEGIQVTDLSVLYFVFVFFQKYRTSFTGSL